MQFKKIYFLQNITMVSDGFNLMGSSFHILGTITEKVALPRLSLVLILYLYSLWKSICATNECR